MLRLRYEHNDNMNKVIQNISVAAGIQQYRSPETGVFFVKTQGLLCQSGNVPVREDDYGDAGFVEV